jgi:hypothetical protein
MRGADYKRILDYNIAKLEAERAAKDGTMTRERFESYHRVTGTHVSERELADALGLRDIPRRRGQ